MGWTLDLSVAGETVSFFLLSLITWMLEEGVECFEADWWLWECRYLNK